MGDQLARGEEFERKAEKKLTSWSFLGSKYEDAADLFDKAANCFKLAKACTSPSSFSRFDFPFLRFVGLEIVFSYEKCQGFWRDRGRLVRVLWISMIGKAQILRIFLRWISF